MEIRQLAVNQRQLLLSRVRVLLYFVWRALERQSILCKRVLSCIQQKPVSFRHWGLAGWCKGVMCLTSSVRPTDIGLQLGKACYPCRGKGRGECFYYTPSKLCLWVGGGGCTVFTLSIPPSIRVTITIWLTNGWNLTKLAQIHHLDGGKK